jgi:tetratricopeptide (TPR) repeat protein
MQRLLCWTAPLLRNRRRVLIVLAIVGVLLAAASPLLWAGYHWLAGRSALRHYHGEEARAHFDQCLRVWPWSRSPVVYLLAARAARRQGDLREADRRLHECQDLQGDEAAPETKLEWALLHAAAGDLETVEEPLKAQARQHPEQAPLILEALIEGYTRMFRVLEALRAADEWLRIEPDNVQALYLRANLHRGLGSAQKSAPDYRRVVELDPSHHEARWRLALALLEIGRYEEALQHLKILRQRQPDEEDIQIREALCLHRLGQGREARALLDSVLARDPDNGQALLVRGQIAQADGQLPEAETRLRRAATLLPYDYKVQWALWDCLRQEEKTDEAEKQRAYTDTLYDRRQRQSELTTHLLPSHPNDPALQCELGKLLIQLGQPEVGVGWLLSTVRLDEHNVPALEALASYYEERGEKDRAEDYRRQAREATRASRSTPKSR